MKINKLKLTNFRNHLKLDLTFDSELVVICGQNGIGKTNVLEAIYLLSCAKSPKAQYDKDLINFDYKHCSISGSVLQEGDDMDLELQIIKNENYENLASKRAKVNKTAKSISYFSGIFNSILFTPQDITLPSESPSKKRHYIDLLLSQVSSAYKKNLAEYTKAIKQRNKLLEQINEFNKGHDQMHYWNDKIQETGLVIQLEREKLFEFLRSKMHEYLNVLNNPSTLLEIHYKKSEINEERLNKYKEAEIASKNTLIGPHREDFTIIINNHDIGEFGSRGQLRTVVLALKLSEIDFIEDQKGERPVLLLDDIFSELDAEHKQTVLNAINRQQTIITGTDVPEFMLSSNPQIISLP